MPPPPSGKGPDRHSDPKVTDLRRYRREREKAERKPAQNAKPAANASGGGFMGSNPKAGLILVVAIVALAAIFILPMFVK